MSKYPEYDVRQSYQVQQYPSRLPDTLDLSGLHNESQQNSNIAPAPVAPVYGFPVTDPNLIPQVIYDFVEELKNKENVNPTAKKKTGNCHNASRKETHRNSQVVYHRASRTETGQCRLSAKQKGTNYGEAGPRIETQMRVVSSYNTPVTSINPVFQPIHNNHCDRLDSRQPVLENNTRSGVYNENIHPVLPATATGHGTETGRHQFPQHVYNYTDQFNSGPNIATSNRIRIIDYHQFHPVVPVSSQYNSVPTNTAPVSQSVCQCGTETDSQRNVSSAKRRNLSNDDEIHPFVPESSVNNTTDPYSDIPQVALDFAYESDSGHKPAKKRKVAAKGGDDSQRQQEERKKRSDIERARIKQMKDAYDNLKSVMSRVAPDEKMTNRNVVKLATSYIQFLEHLTSAQHVQFFTAEEREDEDKIKKKMYQMFNFWMITNSVSQKK